MPKNIISEIEVLVLIYNEIKYLLAVTIIRVEKIVANFWNEAVEEENEVGGGGQKRFRERGWRSRYFNWHMYEWSGSVRRESEDEFLVPNRKKKILNCLQIVNNYTPIKLQPKCWAYVTCPN